MLFAFTILFSLATHTEIVTSVSILQMKKLRLREGARLPGVSPAGNGRGEMLIPRSASLHHILGREEDTGKGPLCQIKVIHVKVAVWKDSDRERVSIPCKMAASSQEPGS